MELKEYIKQSYLRPNKQVLESLGASDELIEYLRTTPWNTNLNIVDSLSESGSGEEKVIFEGDYNFEDGPDILSVNLNGQPLLYPININKIIQINIDGLIYSSVPSQLSSGSTRTIYYIGANSPGDTAGIAEHKVGVMFTALNDSTEIDQIHYLMLDKTERSAGTYHVKIELLN